MNVVLKLAVVSALGGLASCAHTPVTSVDQMATSITPTQLISQSAMLQGQRVVVRGYFTSETDTRALWESEAAALDAREQRLGSHVDYWAKCITVYPEKASNRLDRRSVFITGRVAIIDQDDIRSLWTCNAVALEEAVIEAE